MADEMTYCVLKWHANRCDRGWPRYEVRPDTCGPDPSSYLIIKTGLVFNRANWLCNKLEEENSKCESGQAS